MGQSTKSFVFAAAWPESQILRSLSMCPCLEAKGTGVSASGASASGASAVNAALRIHRQTCFVPRQVPHAGDVAERAGRPSNSGGCRAAISRIHCRQEKDGFSSVRNYRYEGSCRYGRCCICPTSIHAAGLCPRPLHMLNAQQPPARHVGSTRLLQTTLVVCPVLKGSPPRVSKWAKCPFEMMVVFNSPIVDFHGWQVVNSIPPRSPGASSCPFCRALLSGLL